MPRPKVVERQRCIKACESCKKRKEKCDGLKPCANCKKRKREDTCSYAPSTTFRSHATLPLEKHEHVSGNIDESCVMDSPPDISGDINGNEELVDSNILASATSAPVPQLSRLLRDPRGKFSTFSHVHLQLYLTHFE